MEKRYLHIPVFCPWWVGGGAEFIYYDPWSRCIVSEVEVTRLANAPRPNIHGCHSTGSSFEKTQGGSDPNAQTAFNNRQGWDDEVVIDNVKDDFTVGEGLLQAGRVISSRVNVVHVQGLDAYEDENRVCEVY